MKDRMSALSRPEKIVSGLVSIASGLVVVLSLGSITPDWQLRIAFHWSMKRRRKLEASANSYGYHP